MRKRILITPLDWGLGHATRCMPIIQWLMQQNQEVIIAGNGNSLKLLQEEFKQLQFITLPGYNPVYPKDRNMITNMLLQLPKFYKVIQVEHRVIRRVVAEEKIDIVISDNRYGCWSSDVPSILITHQSNVLMPRRFGWASPFVRFMTQRLMNRFDMLWIPDLPGDQGMTQQLIRFGRTGFARETRYIGNLSRMTRDAGIEKTYDVVAVCSGPEPQRTLLEKLLKEQLQKSLLRFLLVRGVPENGQDQTTVNGSRIVNYMTSADLELALQQAEIVISRSGYSTIMDLQALGQKAIFLPTPGQTEQEYLARRLEENGIAYFCDQENFQLMNALNRSRSYSGFPATERSNALLEAALLEILA